MEVKLYLRMLQRGWWLVVVTALAALNVALVVAYLQTPLYRTSARFVVSPNASLTSGRDVITSLEALDKPSIVSTYAEVLNSDRIYRQAVETLQVDADLFEDYQVSTVVLPDTTILQLSVAGPQPQLTALLANHIGQQAIDYIHALNQVYEIGFLDPAAVPTTPFSPQPLRDAGLALALGLVLGAGLAILREQLRIPLDALRQTTMLDGASAAYSRRYFLRRLEDEIGNPQNMPMALGLVHLHGLGDMIERLPLPVVQHLLRQVTRTLRKELRGSDVVGRWEEATFSILLPVTPDKAAMHTLDRIRIALDQPQTLYEGGERVQLAPVMGVAAYTSQETSQHFIERAQQALASAQQQHMPIAFYSAGTTLT